MKLTGLRVLIFPPRPNPHQEVPEYVTSPTRQNGLAVFSTDEGVTGLVSSEAGTLRQLARSWAAAREQVEGQGPFERGRLTTPLRRRYSWPQRVLGTVEGHPGLPT
jgi:hypothetical protein